MTAIALCNAEERKFNTMTWTVIFILFSSFVGGTLSILTQTKRFHFEEFQSHWYYIIAGIERLCLASVAGTIIYIILRSKLVLPQLEIYDYWKFMTILVCSAFSERFVPSMLTKIESNLERGKKVG